MQTANFIMLIQVIVRINELQKLAQELGAKHFKVTYKEEQRSLSEKKANIRGDAKKAVYGEVSGEVNRNYTDKKFSTVEVAAEMSFPGHAPTEPKLKYLNNDPSIKTLIAMRMRQYCIRNLC